MRLRLRMEIRKRVSRIEIKWNKSRPTFCRIIFVNSAKLDKGILFTQQGVTLCQQTSWERPELVDGIPANSTETRPTYEW